jgi:hypothetical protein
VSGRREPLISCENLYANAQTLAVDSAITGL